MKKIVFTLFLTCFLVFVIVYTTINQNVFAFWLSCICGIPLFILVVVNLYIYLANDHETNLKLFAKVMSGLPIIAFVVTYFMVSVIIPSVSTKKSVIVENGTQLYVNEYFTEYLLLSDENEMLFIYLEDESKQLECCVYLKASDVKQGSNMFGYSCIDLDYWGNQLYKKTNLVPYMGEFWDLNSNYRLEPKDFTGRFIFHPETQIVPLEEFWCYDVDPYCMPGDRESELLDSSGFFMLKNSEGMKFKLCDMLDETSLNVEYDFDTYSRAYNQELIEYFSKFLWEFRNESK